MRTSRRGSLRRGHRSRRRCSRPPRAAPALGGRERGGERLAREGEGGDRLRREFAGPADAVDDALRVGGRVRERELPPVLGSGVPRIEVDRVRLQPRPLRVQQEQPGDPENQSGLGAIIVVSVTRGYAAVSVTLLRVRVSVAELPQWLSISTLSWLSPYCHGFATLLVGKSCLCHGPFAYHPRGCTGSVGPAIDGREATGRCARGRGSAVSRWRQSRWCC